MIIRKIFIKSIIFFIFLINTVELYSSPINQEEKKEDSEKNSRKHPLSLNEEDEDTRNPKKHRLSEIIKEKQSQVYAIPTYDATFKHLMSDIEICTSFLRAFIPDANITTVKHLDDHLTPFKEYQSARTFLNDDKSKKAIKSIDQFLKKEENKTEEISFFIKNTKTNKEHIVSGGGEFIKGLSNIYGDILTGYPLPHRNSQVDLLCEVNKSYYALIEIQVIPQDYWDKRALAYAANIYGRQLREGDKWNDIKKVICINLLGGGLKDIKWPKRTGFTHLTFKDQNNRKIEEGIEIFQYPLFYEEIRNSNELEKRLSEEHQKEYLEWIEFFEHAHNKKESDVEKIETKIIKRAYDLIKNSKLPSKVKEEYLQQENELFDKYSHYTEHLTKEAEDKGRQEGEVIGIEKGIDQGKKEIALKMLEEKMDIKKIANFTGLSIEEINKLKK